MNHNRPPNLETRHTRHHGQTTHTWRYTTSLLICAVTHLTPSPTQAADINWVGPVSGNWSNPANWSPTELPNPTHDVFINPDIGLTVVGPDTDTTVSSLSIGGGTGSVQLSLIDGITLDLTGTAPPPHALAMTGLTTLNVTSGATVNTASPAIIAADPSMDNSTVNVVGPATSWRASGTITLGQAGSAVLNVDSGGQVNAPAVDFANQGSATVRVSRGGSLAAEATRFAVNPDADADVRVEGVGSTLQLHDHAAVGIEGTARLAANDTATIYATSITLGQTETGTGHLAVTGQASALLVADTIQVGELGTGTMLLDSGASASAPTLTISTTGTVDLNFATLHAGTINNALGGAFNFNAGQLRIGNHTGTLVNRGGSLQPTPPPAPPPSTPPPPAETTTTEPASPFGIANIDQDYQQLAGDLQIQVATPTAAGDPGTHESPTPGLDHDQLNIAHRALLGGRLDVELTDAETNRPRLGTRYTVMTYDTRNTPDDTPTMFDEIRGTHIDNSFALAPLFTDTDGSGRDKRPHPPGIHPRRPQPRRQRSPPPTSPPSHSTSTPHQASTTKTRK